MSGSYPANPVLLALLKEGSFEHQGQRFAINYSTPPAICKQYGELILERGLRAGVEIGTLFCLSTLHLAEALQRNGGKLDTIDIRYEKREWATGQSIENVHEVAERLVKESDLHEVVNFHVGHSNDVLTQLIREGRTYDFALIDGSHLFSIAMLDFIFVDRLMKEGGVIACEAPRHPLPAMHPDTRAGLIETARRLDPLVLRWSPQIR
jgi:predicted O-methyltransferase YrrM